MFHRLFHRLFCFFGHHYPTFVDSMGWYWICSVCGHRTPLESGR